MILKEKGLQRFDDLQSQFDRVRQSEAKQMGDSESERGVLQEKMNNMETDTDNATCENLKLKGLTFDNDYTITHYKALIDQAQKKIKLL